MNESKKHEHYASGSDYLPREKEDSGQQGQGTTPAGYTSPYTTRTVEDLQGIRRTLLTEQGETAGKLQLIHALLALFER